MGASAFLSRYRAAYERGWSELANSSLLTRAKQEGYELLITTDLNLRYEQNLADRNIAIVVLMTTSWPRIQQQTDRVQAILENDKYSKGGMASVRWEVCDGF